MTRARGRTRRTPGTMNGLEKAWAEELEKRKQAGDVASYHFEAVNIRLAGKCFYKPDFLVVRSDGFVEFHECKGYFEEQAKVRTKVAADKFPEFVFRLVTKRKKADGGGFDVSVIGPAEEMV